jgi:hypothetical protein
MHPPITGTSPMTASVGRWAGPQGVNGVGRQLPAVFAVVGPMASETFLVSVNSCIVGVENNDRAGKTSAAARDLHEGPSTGERDICPARGQAVPTHLRARRPTQRIACLASARRLTNLHIRGNEDE